MEKPHALVVSLIGFLGNLHPLQMVISELDSFIIALGKLKEGYLSPYLVSTTELQVLIDYVTDALSKNYPTYSTRRKLYPLLGPQN